MTTIASFTYDEDGRRVKGTLNGVTTTYIGDLSEWTGSVSTLVRYYYAGGVRVAMKQGSTVYYLLGDHLGSTSVVATSSGGLHGKQLYKPWGEPRYASASLPTAYTYTGQYSYMDDIATPGTTEGFGLMFYQARWYDPSLSRWSQPDSIVPLASQGVQAWDRFAYVSNNPLKFRDTSGHDVGCSDANPKCRNQNNGPKLGSRYDSNYSVWNSGNHACAGCHYSKDSQYTILSNDQWAMADRNARIAAAEAATAAVAGIAIALAAKEIIPAACADSDCTNEVLNVYRVWGSDPDSPGLPGSGPWGHSWSPIDPSTVGNYRNLAGLPSNGVSGAFNTARFVSIGEIVDSAGIMVRQAWSLDGQSGGLVEYIIPDPQVQLLLKFVGGINPPY